MFSQLELYIPEIEPEEEDTPLIKSRGKSTSIKSKGKKSKSVAVKAEATKSTSNYCFSIKYFFMNQNQVIKLIINNYFCSILVRKFVKKGAAPVDPECVQKVESSHVFIEGRVIWDCMLNQVRALQHMISTTRHLHYGSE